MTNQIINLILQGYNDADILAKLGDVITLNKILRTREALCEANFANIRRSLTVTYITCWNADAIAFIANRHPGKTVCVLNFYVGSSRYYLFNDYLGQDILVLNNFSSSLPVERITPLIKDGYPLYLPARHFNRIACFTHVYIVSHIDILSQYSLSHLKPSPDAETLAYHISEFLKEDFTTGHIVKDASVLARLQEDQS